MRRRKNIVQKEANWTPAFYVSIFGILKEAAKEMGYALTIHGSVNRDLDLVAVPWINKAREPKELVDKFISILDLRNYETKTNEINPIYKPHGRECYIIRIGVGYIDLSVIAPKD